MRQTADYDEPDQFIKCKHAQVRPKFNAPAGLEVDLYHCVVCGLMTEYCGELNDQHECEDCESKRVDEEAIESDDEDYPAFGSMIPFLWDVGNSRGRRMD